MNDVQTLDRLFQQALDAIDGDDIQEIQRLLAEQPQLAYSRLEQPGRWLTDQIGPALQGFFKEPYLLWLLTEDAVRTGVLSPHIGDVVRMIVETARRENATNLQELLDSTLHFAICSPIGREDGRQTDLIDSLIDEGASLNGSPAQALICYNFPAAEHLLNRGAPLTLAAAVCLDRWDDVARLGREAGVEGKQEALALAALNGKAQGLASLLPFGVDLDSFDNGFYTHATSLHHAVWSGSLDAVKVLVEAGARLDCTDKAYDATPLGWAEHALSIPAAATSGKEYAQIAAYLRAQQETTL